MSKRIYWIAGLGIAATAAGGAHSQTKQPIPDFNNRDRIDTEPLNNKSVGRTVVPMRDLFESLGAQVEWDPSQRAVYAWRRDGVGVRLALNERSAHTMTMTQNPGPGNWGRVTATQRLDAPAMLVNRRIFVPLRFASEALQADVRFASSPPSAIPVPETWP